MIDDKYLELASCLIGMSEDDFLAVLDSKDCFVILDKEFQLRFNIRLKEFPKLIDNLLLLTPLTTNKIGRPYHCFIASSKYHNDGRKLISRPPLNIGIIPIQNQH